MEISRRNRIKNLVPISIEKVKIFPLTTFISLMVLKLTRKAKDMLLVRKKK